MEAHYTTTSALVNATPEQRRRVDALESILRLAAPGLDLMLAAGERLSRLIGGEDVGYYPVPPPGEVFELPPVPGAPAPPSPADDA
jgi:hypothetical protein